MSNARCIPVKTTSFQKTLHRMCRRQQSCGDKRLCLGTQLRLWWNQGFLRSGASDGQNQVPLYLHPVKPWTRRQVYTSALGLPLIRAILFSATCWHWQEAGWWQAAAEKDGAQESGTWWEKQLGVLDMLNVRLMGGSSSYSKTPFSRWWN